MRNIQAMQVSGHPAAGSLLVGFLVLLLAGVIPITRAGAKPVPNFVFIIADDVSPEDLGPYGNGVIRTPNLDRLAQRSLVFDRAYNVTSSCSPSRCAMITGRYPHNTGAPELHTPLPATQRTFVQELKQAGYYTILSGKNHMARPAQLGFDISSDGKPGGEEKWVQHLRDRPKDQPFFGWFAAHDAHHPFEPNDKAPTYRPEEITVPPMLADGPQTRKELAAYYHEVSRLDYYVGQLMAELQAQGILENTYFIYCSDNGRPFPRCKTYLYDSGTRSPLLITGPGVPTGRSRSFVSAIDYAPTILELAGVPVPKSVQGVSFVPILRDPTAQVRDVVFAERNWHVFSVHQRMVRAGDWLYIWNAWPNQPDLCTESSATSFPAGRELWAMAAQGKLTVAQQLLTLTNQPPEMLFNVAHDPHQFTNLVAETKSTTALQQMRHLLTEWKTQTGDSVPVHPTPSRSTSSESGGPAVQRGEFPGAANNATAINRPGPIRWNQPL